MDLEAPVAKLPGGVLPHPRLLLGQQAILELDDVRAWLIGLDLRVVVPPQPAEEVLHLTGRLDAAEPTAADDERELRPSLLRVLLQLGALEHLDDPVAQCERIGQGLHADRVVADALDAEGRRLAAEGNDQAVVVEPMDVAVASEDADLLGVEVDGLDLRGDRPARWPLELRAEGGHAVACLELPGAHLRQQRREEREVLAADEPDLDVLTPLRQPLEMTRRLDAGEPAAEDEDAVRPRRLSLVDGAHAS